MVTFDPWYVLIASVLSAVGMGVAAYGKRQSEPLWLCIGIAQCIACYVVTSPLPLLLVSAVLMAMLFHQRITYWFAGPRPPRKDIESI